MNYVDVQVCVVLPTVLTLRYWTEWGSRTSIVSFIEIDCATMIQ